jgi:hypothetical protein
VAPVEGCALRGVDGGQLGPSRGVAMISHDYSRARRLAALAPHLPETLLPDALAAARGISDTDARARALAALAFSRPPQSEMAGSSVQQLGRSDLARRGSGGRGYPKILCGVPQAGDPAQFEAQSGQRRARQDGRIAASPFL